MPGLVGYLRHYERWNGAPGLGLDAQKELVRQAVRELDFECPRYRYLVEQRDGQSQGWPMLKKAINMANDYAEQGLLVVIPTLDGVQFNSSFLDLLVYRGFDERPPIYVCSGWRRPKRFAKNTNYPYQAEWRAGCCPWMTRARLSNSWCDKMRQSAWPRRHGMLLEF